MRNESPTLRAVTESYPAGNLHKTNAMKSVLNYFYEYSLWTQARDMRKITRQAVTKVNAPLFMQSCIFLSVKEEGSSKVITYEVKS